jgi:hypothetical protein
MISKTIFSFTVLLLGIVPGTRVLAADMPKEFPFTVTYTNSGTFKVLQQGNASARSFDHTLIATNDAGKGFLHNVTAYCVGMSYHDQDQPPKGGGACTFTDADGDQLFERYTLTKPTGGEIRFIGGTGKYAGIQCQGEWERIAQPKAASEGTWQNIGKKRGNCKLP